MNRKLVGDMLSLIDEKYIEECVLPRENKPCFSSERNKKMNGNRFSRKNGKKILVIAIAACLVLSAVVTAGAANLWGIRELSDQSGAPLPEEAYDYIQPQSASAQSEEWSCRVTESLCDRGSLTVSVAVTCSEKYVLAPPDASPGDSAGAVLGADSGLTLGEYAASQGKELLFVNASLMKNEGFAVVSGMLRFEYVSDSHAVLLAQADIDSDGPVTEGICTVYLTDAQGKRTEQALPFDLSEAPASDSVVFVPVDPDAVAGVKVGKAEVTRTPLGISIIMEETVTDHDAFGRMEFVCEQFPGCMGGSVADADGNWQLELNGGQGEITDTLAIQVRDCATGQPIGEILFVPASQD